MTIKFKDYVIKPTDACPGRFDLFIEQLGNIKGEQTIVERNIGYGFLLENAMLTIVASMAAKDESITDMKSYLREYRRLKDEVVKACTP